MSENTDANILFEMVKAKYGDRLNDEQLGELKSDIENLSDMVQDVRKQKLENGDEPFSVFTPYRDEE